MVSSSAAVRSARRSRRQRIRSFLFRVRTQAKPLFIAFCLIFFPFVRWFEIPSPFAAALLLAFADRPSPLALVGLGASLLLRLLWGLEWDGWQYAGCVGLWLLLQRVRPRAGVEVAALGGLSMLARVLAAIASGQPLPILLSWAAVPLCMLFSVLMRHGMDALEENGAAMRGGERFCVLLIGLVLLSGMGYFRLGALNVGQAAAVVATCAFAWANGPVYGVAGGLLCGLSLALGGHDAYGMLPLALGGFLAGLPILVRRRWLCIPAQALACGLSWLVAPQLGFTSGSMAAIPGALCYGLLSQRTLDRLRPWLHGVEARDRSMENAFVTHRIEHMRSAIEALARALPAWEEEEGENLPADGTREVWLARKKREASRQKARYERELTLTHLAAISSTLEELREMAAGESFHDLRAAHVMTLALEELQIPARLCYARRVEGHLQAALEAESMTPVQKPLSQLLAYLAREEELPLAVTRSERGKIELEEIPLYSATVGTASVCAAGEETRLCGDACCVRRCEGGRLLMMLCDGMGHGEKAHRQSEKTLELLLLLLQAGYTRHQAITAVNGIMLGAQSEERFSTVDLADIDLWTGEVYGEKLGACASWVIRGSHMKKIEGSSLPLGILQEAVSTPSQYRLHSGDILVLMSDGVADAFEEDEALKKALEESLFIEPQRMADALLRSAIIAGGGISRDDMSVMVLLLMDRQHES